MSERLDTRRPASDFVAHRFPSLEHDDPPERYQRLWNARSLGRHRTDPALYAYALRRFLLEDDDPCRNAALWLMRDAWKVDRDLERGPIRAALAGAAMGRCEVFWERVAALLGDPTKRRDTPFGEHLEWIAKQADDPLVAVLRHHPPAAFAVAGASVTAAQDPAVRTYPRAAFVQLAGRVLAAVPDVREQVATGLRALAATDINYDIRYWVDRVLAALDEPPPAR